MKSPEQRLRDSEILRVPSEEFSLQRTLGPVDISEKALVYAVSFARGFKAEVLLPSSSW